MKEINNLANTVSTVAWATVAVGIAIYWVYNAKQIIAENKRNRY